VPSAAAVSVVLLVLSLVVLLLIRGLGRLGSAASMREVADGR
jgi:ABC-type sulfate transport system permease component